MTPSSCNRQAIVLRVVVELEDRMRLQRLLVGGRDWIGRAPVVLLLFAEMGAYKAPGEDAFMPYLDAGFAACCGMLAAENVGLGACYVNPNVRPDDVPAFTAAFGDEGLRFCGALALGYRRDRPLPAPRRELEDVFVGGKER